MLSHFSAELYQARHADLLRDAEAYRIAAAQRPRRPRRRRFTRRHTAA